MLKKDGHTHTKWSHHGSNQSLEEYIERAIALGFDEYTVSEHAPLPLDFLKNSIGPIDDSAMHWEELNDYQAEVTRLKKKYAAKINIKQGFEIDYIADYEPQIRVFLRDNSDWIDEIVLSVHFMKNRAGQLYGIDYSPELLAEGFKLELANPQELFQRYYATLAQSVEFITGLPQNINIRIGHMTLIRKYQKYFDLPDFDHNIYSTIRDILEMLHNRHYQLDFNAAGISKPYNGEPYPSLDIAKAAHEMGITLVYGSDAHQVQDVGQHFDIIQQAMQSFDKIVHDEQA